MSFADIPPEELPLLPALAPPNGTVSNFINPENRADAYIVVAGIFIGLAAISVILRLYVRISLQKTPWWDDFIAVIALLTQASYTGINIWLCKHGVGKHMWDVRLIDLLPVITPARVMADITEPSIGLTKLALLLLYYRLFSPDPIVKFAILAGIVFICVCYTTLMFLFIFLSTDKTTKVNKTMAIINVLTDTYILVLPIYSVLKLYLPRRRKIGLALIFATGAFAMAMSIVGAVFRFKFADDGTDFTWGLLNVILVNQIECCVGIMCACMPLFPALLSKANLMGSDWMITMRSLRDRIFRSGNGSAGSGGSRGTRGSKKDKHADTDDFVKLNGQSPSAASSLKNLGNQHHATTEIEIMTPSLPRTETHGIEVTTNYTVGRTST
ncbi:hypothetical protein ACHAPC_011191 [Botrytis cinerea]|uniref:Putative plasma membrane protein pth11-protein n=1 Tax=Botryotinia fuckeliana (strain BcDW1) TaxID=1290391 RepID=M7UGC7_BOTF1|nr:putative plasma membrane protein pth11- protein [Botrytis cinerea BcDW1]